MRNRILVLVLLTLSGSPSLRAQAIKKSPLKSKPAGASAEEVSQLRETVAAQGKQIEELKARVERLAAASEKAVAAGRETAIAAQEAGTNLPVVSGADSYAFGGQLSGRLQFSRRVSTTLVGTALNWQNVNPIIQAVTARTLAGNRNTNATVGSGPTIAYASKFLYVDFIADTVVQTWSERFPWRILLDFVDNPRASSSQRHGFWGEMSLGQQRDRNDFQFGYSFGRIEQDAVIASFNESEMRAPTNIVQHRVFLGWLPVKNTTALFTGWFGRTLNRGLQNAAIPPGLPPGDKDPYVKRLQFDLIYKF